MIARNEELYRITVGENPDYLIPALGYRGSPTGIDIMKVIETGVLPVMDVGIAGRDGGQIGAGVVRAPARLLRSCCRSLSPALQLMHGHAGGGRFPMAGFDTYELGDVPLQSGAVLRNAKLAYATYGTLNAGGGQCRSCCRPSTPAPISATSRCSAAGRAIDPARHFVVSINLIGNGYSSSPSNAPPPQDGPRFPHVTLFDNVACQHRLLTERLGVKRIALVLGWSMAAMQAYQWAAQYPDMVEAILPYCGAARCSPLNYAFLDGPKAALAGGLRLERRRLRHAAGEGLARVRPRLCRLGLLP